MKLRKVMFTAMVIASLLFATSLEAQAVPPKPSGFWGTAEINGVNVGAGVVVSAWVGGVQYASSTTISGGFYSLDVPGDDPGTPGVEGGKLGDTVSFRIDSLTAGESGTWAEGTNVRLDLSAWECYSLTRSRTGNGTNPTASPANSPQCPSGKYIPGAVINLSGAVPDTGWQIDSWTGTNNNASTAATNTVTMPTGPHTVTVNYTQICYPLTLTKTGNGSTPVANPTHSTGCPVGQYTYQQSISLSGASPDPDWKITGWTGTNNNTSTAATNTVTMPASAHSAGVTYSLSCYQLTRSHTGNGSDPVASPTHSTGCPTGQYLSGETINLSGAVPNTGWQIDSWAGTNNNASTAAANTVTMPVSPHTVTVNYTQICYQLTLTKTGNGSTPVANPTHSTGCPVGQYTYQQSISLSGAIPDAGWQIAGWKGTTNNASTASTNTVNMPAGNHTARVNYTVFVPDCYPLTITKEGNGSVPMAAPTNSADCPINQYIAGQDISLSGATPDAGWQITGWTGTINNTSTAAINTVTMPGNAHTASVIYSQIKHLLTVNKVGQGTVTSSPAGINCGVTCSVLFDTDKVVTLTATPQAGWEFAGWSGDCTGMTCQVTMNQAKSVTATFTAYEVPFMFDDVPGGHWAFDWIYRLYAAGITKGCSQEPPLYCPDNDVTRAEMAVFLIRGLEGPEYKPPTGTGTLFDDVPEGYWALDWIEQLYEVGVTKGCREDPLSYCPDNPVTRAEMAVFLLRVKYGNDYTPPEVSKSSFKDVPDGHWALNWIEQMYADGITSGCSEEPLLYCPEQPVTRAEMAVFLVRIFDLP